MGSHKKCDPVGNHRQCATKCTCCDQQLSLVTCLSPVVTDTHTRVQHGSCVDNDCSPTVGTEHLDFFYRLF